MANGQQTLGVWLVLSGSPGCMHSSRAAEACVTVFPAQAILFALLLSQSFLITMSNLILAGYLSGVSSPSLKSTF